MTFLKAFLTVLGCLILALPIVGQPVANFSANPTSGCSPLKVNFTDLSTGNPTSYTWIFGNGNTSDTSDPSVIYITPGTYDVTLIVSNASGADTIVKQNFITVFENPIAAISGVPRTGCVPLDVAFSDNSTLGDAPIVSWLWDFGDGQISQVKNPSHTYQTDGSFKVSLRVIDGNGCQSLISHDNYVVVDPAPIADFEADDRIHCSVPLTVNFTDQTTGSGSFSYQWDFGDGSTGTGANPSHTYTDTGSFDVRLIVSNNKGCGDTIVKSNHIQVYNLDPVIGVDKLHGCTYPMQTEFQFTDLTTAPHSVTFWKFGDGFSATQQNPTHRFNKPDTFNVLMVVGNGVCLDTAEQQIFIQEIEAEFEIDSVFSCDTPFTVTLTENSIGGTAWDWSFQDGTTATGPTTSHVIHNEGQYLIKLTATNQYGCEDSIIKKVTIDIPKVDIFTQDQEGCVPLSSTFIAIPNTSQVISGYEWTFHNGTSATGNVSNFTFPDTGVYPVVLKATTERGCEAWDTLNIKVGNHPKITFASLDKDTFCYKEPILMTINGIGIDSISAWIYGAHDTLRGGFHYPDGAIHATCTPGTFNAIVLYPYNNGCLGDVVVLTDTFEVIGVKPSFRDSIDCTNPYQVFFINESEGDVANFKWSFPDGSQVTTKDAIYTFSSRGTFEVTLAGADTAGKCSATYSPKIFIYDPKAVILASDTAQCHALSEITLVGENSLDAYKYRWALPPDGQYSPDSNIAKFTLDSAGVHYVTLVVEDMRGCMDTTRQRLQVYQHDSEIDFSGATEDCVPLSASMNALVTADTTVTSYEWNVTGLPTQFTPNINFVLQNAGQYTVNLKTTDANGCTAEAELELTAAKPQAIFFAQEIKACRYEPILFENYSQPDGALTYQWYFGDGGTDTAHQPNYPFTKTGIFDVILIVTDTLGCSDTLTRKNHITITAPIADLAVSDTFAPCPPLLVEYFDRSLGNIVAWDWDFGDNAGSVLEKPQHNYTGTGFFDVTLAVTDNEGCTDTVVYQDLIEIGGPRGIISVEPDSGCSPLTVTFTVSQPEDVQNVEWDFGDGRSGNGLTVTHTYTSKGTYYPNVILSNDDCSGSFEAIDTIVVDTIKADFTIADDELCDGEAVTVADQTLGIITGWQWEIGTQTHSGKNVPPVQLPTGTYTVKLVATSELGCLDSITKSFTVNPNPVASVDGDTFACEGTPAQLVGNSSAPSTYEWLPPDGLDQPTSRTPLATPTANTIYSVIVTDDNGCSDTSSGHLLKIFPNLTGDAGPDTTIYAGDSVQLYVTHNLPVTGYSWITDPTLSCDTCVHPWASPLQTTEYLVELEDTVGCDKITLKAIILVTDEVKVAVPEAFSPNGDGTNDFLFVLGVGIKELLDFKIYNRWGELVYESTSLEDGWDGTYQGEPQDVGSFVYVAKVRSYSDREVVRKGSFSLLR